MKSKIANTQELTALLISPDRDLADQFTESLRHSGAFQVIADLKSYPTTHSLEIRLRQICPEVVLLDLASDKAVAADLLRFMANCTPPVQVVGLSPKSEREILLNSLRSGASEFLHAPFDAKHQAEAVSRLARLRNPEGDPASLFGTVTVFSNTKPGSGASTLALYSAIAVRRLTCKKVLLVDLDLKGGSLAFYGRLRTSHSILDALDAAGELTPSLWPSLVADLDGLDVLTGPEKPFTGPIDSERLNAILHFARGHYNHVLIDLPIVFDRWSLLALSNSERALLVSSPELPCLHLARKAVQLLDQLGFPKDRFQILLNRVNRKEELSRSDMEKLFNCPIYSEFPNDFYSLNRVLTRGQELDASSGLSKAIDHFATKLAGTPELRT